MSKEIIFDILLIIDVLNIKFFCWVMIFLSLCVVCVGVRMSGASENIMT